MQDHAGTPPVNGPWGDAFALLREWDPEWAEACRAMSTNPWEGGVLPLRTVELIGIALSAACTNLDPDGTRRHIVAALRAGASRAEVLAVLKMASLMAIHSCSLGAPILIEEARAAGLDPARPGTPPATPACERMRDIGQWNEAWNPFFELDPAWTDQFMASGAGLYAGGVLDARTVELLSIAFDASFTHMYAPGTRRHIRAALKLGASVQEVMEVLKLCVVRGVQACNLGLPILARALAEVAQEGPADGN